MQLQINQTRDHQLEPEYRTGNTNNDRALLQSQPGLDFDGLLFAYTLGAEAFGSETRLRN